MSNINKANLFLKETIMIDDSIFKDIKTDYIDDNGVLFIDGYKTEDDNEEGTGIGYFINGEIYWRDAEYQFDPYVKDVIKYLKDNFEDKSVEEAKQTLTNDGYYIGSLWHLEDVKSKFECTDDEAFDILSQCVDNEWIIEQINVELLMMQEIMTA